MNALGISLSFNWIPHQVQNDRKPLSSLGEGRSPETRGSINNDINILDSRVFANATHKNDNKKESSSDVPPLSSLGDIPPLSSLGEGRSPETRGSINNDINILDSRVFVNATHKNDNKKEPSLCDIPLSVILGRGT